MSQVCSINTNPTPVKISFPNGGCYRGAPLYIKDKSTFGTPKLVHYSMHPLLAVTYNPLREILYSVFIFQGGPDNSAKVVL